MTTPSNWRGVVNYYKSLDQRIQDYFSHLPGLAENYPWDVCISYLFAKVELAQNMAIYCSAVKLHRVHTQIAYAAIENHHMTRDGFRELLKTVTGRKVPQTVIDKISAAETVRDRLLHGKRVTEQAKRQAVIDLLDYASNLNQHMHDSHGIRPFGKLKGFKGRSKPLDKSTSRWVLKGMGLTGI